MKKKIVVIGSMNMDLVVETEHYPQRGETLFGNSFSQIPGGKGANQAVAAGKLGGEVSFIGACGQDSFGRELIDNLQKHGVNTDYVFRVNEATGIAQIIVEQSCGDNRIIVVPGANGLLKPELIEGLIEEIREADIILLQLEIPVETVIYILEKLSDSENIIILDPAPAVQLPREIFSHIDYILPNEGELNSLVTGNAKDPAEKAGQLLSWGVGAVLLTKGAQGVSLYRGKEQKDFKALPVEAVDTTAAGDAFAGAFAYGLSQNWPEEKAINFAQKVAAFSVTKLGAQSSLPSWEEVERFSLS